MKLGHDANFSAGATPGISFSATRICFADGHIYKIIGDAGPGGTNVPGFSDNDFVDKSSYVPAIDPSTP